MKELILKLRAREDALYSELEELKATLAYLKRICEHEWKYTRTGRHGSDKGDEYYVCQVCGDEKVE